MLQDILRLLMLQEIHDEWRFTEGNCQLLTVSSYVNSWYKEIQALIHCLYSEVCSCVCANLKPWYCIDCYAYYDYIYKV